MAAKPTPLYKRNLIVLWFGSFFTGAGISLVVPFIPLFIDTLGDFTHQELSFYSGLVVASAFFFMAIMAPFWGSLADRHGRKLILLCSSSGMAITMAAIGFVTNVWALLALRSIYGLVSGFIANSVALMAVQTPREESGKVMGTLNTAGVGGALVGPLIGGTLVPLIGYAHLFWVTGAIIGLIFFVTLIFVKEDSVPGQKGQKGQKQSAREVFAGVSNMQLIIGMFFTTLMISVANSTSNPILSLYVREILPAGGNVEFWSGVAAAAPGVVTIIAAPQLGALGDKIGTNKILVAGLLLQILVFLPMAFVTSIWQLVVLRLVLGVSNASLMPSVQAILTQMSPKWATSRIFSFNQSANSVGFVLGPLIGAAISGMLAFKYVFFAGIAFSLANLVVVWRVNRKVRDTDRDRKRERE